MSDNVFYAYEEEHGHIPGIKLDDWMLGENYERMLESGYYCVLNHRRLDKAGYIWAHKSNTPVTLVKDVTNLPRKVWHGVHVGFSEIWGRR